MKLASHLSVAALLLASALPAAAHVTVFATPLTGAAESPPSGSFGTGSAIVTIDDHDFTMRVQTTFAGLTGDVTIAHIHCCTAQPGTSIAGVASQLPSFPGFPAGLGVTAGTYDQTFDMTDNSSWNPAFVNANGGTTGTAFSALLAGLNGGTAYLNIHTSVAAAGEIRGFLAPVPEPATWALMLAGLALAGLVARRR